MRADGAQSLSCLCSTSSLSARARLNLGKVPIIHQRREPVEHTLNVLVGEHRKHRVSVSGRRQAQHVAGKNRRAVRVVRDVKDQRVAVAAHLETPFEPDVLETGKRCWRA